MFRPDPDWVPAIRSLEDITALPLQRRHGLRLVVACPPCDVDAWRAGADAAGIEDGDLELVVIATQGLPEGTALTWNASKPGRPKPPSFDRYYREESA